MAVKRTKVDMSSEAIAGRLKEIGELWDLWNRLKKAERLGSVEPNGILKEESEEAIDANRR